MKRKLISLFLIILLILCICNACGTKNDSERATSDHLEGEEADPIEKTESPTMTELPREEEADTMGETEPPKEDETVDDYNDMVRSTLNKGTVEDYKEMKLDKPGYLIYEFDVKKNGDLFSVLPKGILTWDRKKWKNGKVGKGLDKFLKENKGYEIVGYSNEGHYYVVQYVYEDEEDHSSKMLASILYEFTGDGKVIYSYDLKKVRAEENVRVLCCYPIGNHEVVMEFSADDYKYRFDLKKGKLSRYEQIPESYLALRLVKDGKMYFIDEDDENTGFITVRDVESGKFLNMIDYTPLQTGIMEEDFYEESWNLDDDSDDDVGGGKGCLEYQKPSLDVYDGKLYAAYITGIYVYNEQEGTWDMLVDAYKGRMDLRRMCITSFKVVEEGLFYCMGVMYGGESEGANMFNEFRKNE